MKKLSLAKMLMIAGISLGTSSAFASMALAIPRDSSGSVGQNIVVSSMFQYSIDNNTTSFQNYVGFEEVEVQGQKVSRPINFSLPAHGSKRVNGDIVSFAHPSTQVGDFTIRSMIKIMGMNGAVHSAHSTLHVTG